MKAVDEYKLKNQEFMNKLPYARLEDLDALNEKFKKRNHAVQSGANNKNKSNQFIEHDDSDSEDDKFVLKHEPDSETPEEPQPKVATKRKAEAVTSLKNKLKNK